MLVEISYVYCYGEAYIPPKDWKYSHNMVNRLYYIHHGSGEYICGGQKYKLKKNRLYLFPEGAEFNVISYEDDPLYHTYIDFEVIPPFTYRKVFEMDIESDSFLKASCGIFLEGAKMFSEGGILSDEILRRGTAAGLCFANICYLCEKITGDIKNADADIYVKDELVNNVVREIIKNIDKELSVKELAKQFFITPNALIRRFKKKVNTTPYAYLKKLRINKAYHMTQRGYSAEEAAHACGYSDASSLLHAMRKFKDLK